MNAKQSLWRLAAVGGVLFALLCVGLPVKGGMKADALAPVAAPDGPGSTPPDPGSDLEWNGPYNTVADIQAAFNVARNNDNPALPALSMPGQSEWNSKSNSEKALFLINSERAARGIHEYHGVESNVTGVAQYYADYLLDNDRWGHYEDGRSPWQRLHDNSAIGACHDNLPIAENIAVFVTSGGSIAMPVERSVYNWLYDDGNCCGWGHRHAMLYYNYAENGGNSSKEGFMGIGRASGGPYQGPFDDSWPFAEMIVFNTFDPCGSWNYGSQPPPPPPPPGIWHYIPFLKKP